MMWCLMLVTSFFIGQSLCCIECNSKGKEAMNRFKTFIRSQVDENSEAYVSLQRFVKFAQREVLDYLEDEVGLLETYAIKEIASEYKKSIDVIEGADFKEVQLIHIIVLHFQRLKDKLKSIAQESHNRRCPNKQGAGSCGLMVQRYTNCKTCEEEKVICAGGPPKNQEYFDSCSCMCISKKCFDLKTGLSCFPCKDHESRTAEAINCGDRIIDVTEDDDLILDCSFGWHARLEDSYKNTFFKVSKKEPKVTEDPYLLIKGIQMEDYGRYMCVTSLNSGRPVSSISYLVIVNRGSVKATEKYKAHPTLPDMLDITEPERPLIEDVGKSNKVLLVITVAGAITILLLAGICICIFWRKKKTQEPLEKRTSIKAECQDQANNCHRKKKKHLKK